MKKKVIIALLALTMAFAACNGSDEDVTGSVKEREDTSVEETAQEDKDEEASDDKETDDTDVQEDQAQEETDGEDTDETDAGDTPTLSQGSMQGGIYTNTFLGIGCEFDSDWTIASEEELLELSGVVVDQMEDGGYQGTLDTTGMIYDLYAYVDDGMKSVNIILQNINVLFQMTMSESDYVEANMQSVEDALKAMGYDTVTATASTVMFAGKEHAALIVEGNYGDITIYEKQVVIKEGDYMAGVTVASFYEDNTDEMLNAFYEVQ